MCIDTMATCIKEGSCNQDQKTWCVGYECSDSYIIRSNELRGHGQPCSESSQCESLFCKKPMCDQISGILDAEQCKKIGGVCLLSSENLYQ